MKNTQKIATTLLGLGMAACSSLPDGYGVHTMINLRNGDEPIELGELYHVDECAGMALDAKNVPLIRTSKPYRIEGEDYYRTYFYLTAKHYMDNPVSGAKVAKAEVLHDAEFEAEVITDPNINGLLAGMYKNDPFVSRLLQVDDWGSSRLELGKWYSIGKEEAEYLREIGVPFLHASCGIVKGYFVHPDQFENCPCPLAKLIELEFKNAGHLWYHIGGSSIQLSRFYGPLGTELSDSIKNCVPLDDPVNPNEFKSKIDLDSDGEADTTLKALVSSSEQLSARSQKLEEETNYLKAKLQGKVRELSRLKSTYEDGCYFDHEECLPAKTVEDYRHSLEILGNAWRCVGEESVSSCLKDALLTSRNDSGVIVRPCDISNEEKGYCIDHVREPLIERAGILLGRLQNCYEEKIGEELSACVVSVYK